MAESSDEDCRFTQNSTVQGGGIGAPPISSLSSTPSKLNACPTLPAAKAAPFCSMPLSLPEISLALSAAGHQLTKPLGAGTQEPGMATKCAVSVLLPSINKLSGLAAPAASPDQLAKVHPTSGIAVNITLEFRS